MSRYGVKTVNHGSTVCCAFFLHLWIFSRPGYCFVFLYFASIYTIQKKQAGEFLLAAGGKMLILLDLRVTHNFEYFPSCCFWQIFIPYICPFFPHLFLLQILTHTGCSLNKIVTLVLRSTQ